MYRVLNPYVESICTTKQRTSSGQRMESRSQKYICSKHDQINIAFSCVLFKICLSGHHFPHFTLAMIMWRWCWRGLVLAFAIGSLIKVKCGRLKANSYINKLFYAKNERKKSKAEKNIRKIWWPLSLCEHDSHGTWRSIIIAKNW